MLFKEMVVVSLECFHFIFIFICSQLLGFIFVLGNYDYTLFKSEVDVITFCCGILQANFV